MAASALLTLQQGDVFEAVALQIARRGDVLNKVVTGSLAVATFAIRELIT